MVGKDILKTHSELLPDLHNITIFLPSLQYQNEFCIKLVKNAEKYNFNALILPRCTTLHEWAFSNYPPDKPLLSQHSRELIFVDALKQQPSLFSNTNPWAIASELLSLFDAMLLNNLKNISIENQLEDANSSIPAVISQEADLVKILWEAWKQQLSIEHALDPIAAYVNALDNIEVLKDSIFYTIGIDDISQCELSLLCKIETVSNLKTFLYANDTKLSNKSEQTIRKHSHANIYGDQYSYDRISPYSKFLDSVFADNKLNIKQRADKFVEKYSNSPVNSKLFIYKCDSFEIHAKAIDIKIRKWIYDDKKNIAVVSTDRKLVRRLRAVLEHANIKVNDYGGWAFSTTSAAAVIECWLRIIEDDYPANDILALFYSPFFPIKEDISFHENAIMFFEKNILLKYEIQYNLKQYFHALDEYHSNENNEPNVEYLITVLEYIDRATNNIAKLRDTNYFSLHQFIDELLNSLKVVGLYTNLKKDDAGKQIIELFESQNSIFRKIDNQLDWTECRHFLAHILDIQNYKPPKVDSCITFCSLEQSRLLNFDALVIASADKDHLPGLSSNYIFFNESIRSELKIPTWRDAKALRLYHFRRILEAAPNILVTIQTKNNDEKLMVCPWVEAIESFHKFAYGTDLSDKELEILVEGENSVVTHQQHISLPELTVQPSPALVKELKPDSISISQFQLLVNCPYQFFVDVCLNITKTQEQSENLDKANFGNLVHKCIHAFFINDASLPGPFGEKVTLHNFKDAESMLISISKNVFSKHIARSFSNELWLRHWLRLIPKFIKWEIQRQKEFTPTKHEISLSNNIKENISLHGRVDRIDSSSYGNAIIDYKTGQTPSRKSIIAGEHVQLSSYALLDENCCQIEYVTIGKNNDVKTEARIKGDELQELVDANLNRINIFSKNLNSGIHFTAHADDDTCRWCEVRGLCRRDYWKS